MSLTSYQTAPPRGNYILFLSLLSFLTLLILSCRILFFFSDGFSYVFFNLIILKKPSRCSFLFKTLSACSTLLSLTSILITTSRKRVKYHFCIYMSIYFIHHKELFLCCFSFIFFSLFILLSAFSMASIKSFCVNKFRATGSFGFKLL